MIKPIETIYKGYRFRSRLEARWAVFFDALEIEWEYEKEGYDIDGMWYLPDFWFTKHNYFAEVKPKEFTELERNKCLSVVKELHRSCILLVGLPSFIEYEVIYSFNTGIKDFMIIENYKGVIDQSFDNKYFVFYLYNHYGNRYHNAVNASRAARFEYGENGGIRK